MQWTTEEGAGFTTGTPWLGIPANHTYIHVESEEKDPDSILAFYKKLVALRKEYEIIADGTIKITDAGSEDIISYERELDGAKLSVFCNLKGQETPLGEAFCLEGKKILACNYPDPEGCVKVLRPFEAVAVLA